MGEVNIPRDVWVAAVFSWSHSNNENLIAVHFIDRHEKLGPEFHNGKILLRFRLGDKTYFAGFHLMESASFDIMLGRDWLHLSGLIVVKGKLVHCFSISWTNKLSRVGNLDFAFSFAR